MPEPQNTQAQTASPTILVVTDNPTTAKLCKTTLQQAGYILLAADGSSEALKICTEQKGPIDLLLTDLILPPPGFQLASSTNQFPHVHGHELAIRAATIRKGLRVILMSGNPEKELASFGIKRDTLPCLAKPFEAVDLLTVVRDVLATAPPALDVSAQAKAANDVGWFG
jgi:CheY-like chemotaxis protein